MKFEPRDRVFSRPLDQPWFNDPLAVIFVAVVVFSICALVVYFIQDYRERRALEQFSAALQQSTEQMKRSFEQPVVRQPRQAWQAPVRSEPVMAREYMPPRTVEVCKKLTAGVINEQFAKCRAGYWVTYRVR